MRTRYPITLFMLLVLLAGQARGASYYIDPTAGAGGDGSIGAPFDAWSDVTWAAGNSYLQKRGTTATLTAAVMPTTPCVDAGTTIAEVAADIRNLSRPQGKAYDIGCFERRQGNLWIHK